MFTASHGSRLIQWKKCQKISAVCIATDSRAFEINFLHCYYLRSCVNILVQLLS